MRVKRKRETDLYPMHLRLNFSFKLKFLFNMKTFLLILPISYNNFRGIYSSRIVTRAFCMEKLPIFFFHMINWSAAPYPNCVILEWIVSTMPPKKMNPIHFRAMYWADFQSCDLPFIALEMLLTFKSSISPKVNVLTFVFLVSFFRKL